MERGSKCRFQIDRVFFFAQKWSSFFFGGDVWTGTGAELWIRNVIIQWDAINFVKWDRNICSLRIEVEIKKYFYDEFLISKWYSLYRIGDICHDITLYQWKKIEKFFPLSAIILSSFSLSSWCRSSWMSSVTAIGLKVKGLLFESVTHIVAIKLTYSPSNNPYLDDVVSHLDSEFMIAWPFLSIEPFSGLNWL